MLSMPAYMENTGILSTKLACLYKRNEGSTLPSTQATMLLLDPECGNMKAVSNQTNAQMTISSDITFAFTFCTFLP